MNYKTGRLVGQILFFISICLLCITAFFNLTGIIVPILIITGVITALAGLIVYFLFWRCPYCHKNLPIKSMYDIDYCPNCGKKII